MARSVPIWKILRFAKVSLYLERFVPRHATAHIHNVIGNAWTTSQHQTDRQEIDNENSLKRHFMTIHFKETIKPINLKEC